MRTVLKLSIVAGSLGSLTGCPLDERTLEGLEVVVNGGRSGQATGGTGGEDDGGDAGSGNGGSFAQGGNSGSTAQGGSSGVTSGSGGTGASGRCPDLDANSVLDCSETLALNGTFDSDTLPWATEANVVAVAWNETDAHGNAESGSLGVENRNEQDQNGTSMLGARLCVPVVGNTAYHFAVEAFIPEDAENAQAGMLLLLYEGPACTGTLLDAPPPSNFVSGPAWSVAQVTYLTPASARSVIVRLVSMKPFRDPPVEVLYDNLLVRED